MLITFEGVEGAGKSTQIKLLENFLINNGREVIITRQPGGSILGGKIRELILDPNSTDKPSTLAEMFLYLADRAHHIETVIEPSIEKGIIVLCDRYVESHLAYQGYARGFNLETLTTLNGIATRNLKPDITFIFDLSPEEGLKRVREGRNQTELDRIESEKIEFHHRVRNGFLDLAAKDPERIKVIDASHSLKNVHQQILDIIKSKL